MARSRHINNECAEEQKERWGEMKLSQIKYNLNFTLFSLLIQMQ
jgi:hypothetical protein